MTIEEKARAYDEAIKRAKDSFNYPDYPGFIRADVVFPELKDNDDNIRKEIINYFKCQNREEPSRKDIHNKWIAWLEKQGNKSVNIDIESMVSSYKQRVLSQSNGVRNNPLINMCLTAFRRGIENTLDKLHLKQCEQKPANKVKPKFDVGDTIMDKEFYESGRETIKAIKDGQYIFISGSSINIDEQDSWKLELTSDMPFVFNK